jgi:hypothetical protein
MREKSDFAMGDEGKDYCVGCTNEDGAMHTFEQQKESMTDFIVNTQGLAHEVSAEAALSIMRKLPARAGEFDS